MATRHQISCINKNDRQSAHERISHVGGINNDKSRWKLTEDEAIRAIENGTYEFYVMNKGYSANVIVATRLGRKYLKTVNDGEQPDNLLSLPECP